MLFWSPYKFSLFGFPWFYTPLEFSSISLFSKFKGSCFCKHCLNTDISKRSSAPLTPLPFSGWSIFIVATAVFSDDFQPFISSRTLPLQLQTCVANCLWEISTWMSYRHLKHNMFQTESSSFPWAGTFSVTLWLSCWFSSNSSPKLGVVFDSSYTPMLQIRSTDFTFKTGPAFVSFSLMLAVSVLVWASFYHLSHDFWKCLLISLPDSVLSLSSPLNVIWDKEVAISLLYKTFVGSSLPIG